MFGCANHPLFGPLSWNHSERHEIVLTGDLAKFGVQANIHSEPRERFEVSAEALGGSVEDPIGRFRIVKPIAERSIWPGERPVRRLPGIEAPTNPEDRSVGVDTERND